MRSVLLRRVRRATTRAVPRRSRCPKCSGACVCRACLRDPIPPPAIADAIPPHRLRGLYEDLVASCAHALKITAERETSEMAADAECAATRDSHEDALDASSTRGWRLFCDQCGGAVANLHRSCWACEVDLCVECCSDLRCGVGVGSPGWKNAGGAPAATPASALVGAGKGGVSHAGSHNKRTRDQIEHPSTDDSKPAGERPSETTLAALPVKKRLKLAATRTDSGTVVSKPDVSNAAKSSGIKIEPDASVKSSGRGVEPLHGALAVRACPARWSSDRAWSESGSTGYTSRRGISERSRSSRRRGRSGGKESSRDDGEKRRPLDEGADERCPWCSALPVGSSECATAARGLGWCPSARDLRDAGADAGADGVPTWWGRSRDDCRPRDADGPRRPAPLSLALGSGRTGRRPRNRSRRGGGGLVPRDARTRAPRRRRGCRRRHDRR